ncbi:MAG TPA: PIN domain-containing protein [Thermoflexales bacterium]|nr:PIN domain-containing protein [Thermoflexales bacterium]HQZ22465.1 PIN domain-containing protein [Thermoflexales bacterium]HQZ99406.1 PIN domain-containing protein [Thermoflexales bacterium]
MLSVDTNILFYALNANAPLNTKAVDFLQSFQDSEEMALSELVLTELYCLLRNPIILAHPLPAAEAVDVIQHFRNHPKWRLIGFPQNSRVLHDQLWKYAAQRDFAYRRVYDARLALTLLQNGVTEFASVNAKDFAKLGFKRVWNPLG